MPFYDPNNNNQKNESDIIFEKYNNQSVGNYQKKVSDLEKEESEDRTYWTFKGMKRTENIEE